MINNVSLNNLNTPKLAPKQAKADTVSFGAAKIKDTSSEKQAVPLKKVAIAATAALVLALPIVLAKAPISKIKPLAAMQTHLNNFLQNTVKPVINKLLGSKGSADAGLNVVR